MCIASKFIVRYIRCLLMFVLLADADTNLGVCVKFFTLPRIDTSLEYVIWKQSPSIYSRGLQNECYIRNT